MKLTREEQAVLESVEQGEWQSVPEFDAVKDRYQEYARATFTKDKRINIRLPEKDLKKIQVRALREGLPYQTLIASILHKYAHGRLKDVSSE
ncbi:MAG: CopG family antitoxin [Desulfohalobiaceae bacterium]